MRDVHDKLDRRIEPHVMSSFAETQCQILQNEIEHVRLFPWLLWQFDIHPWLSLLSFACAPVILPSLDPL